VGTRSEAVHYRFYRDLISEFKLPPKFAIACQKEAITIVKSVLNNENNRGKCIIRSYRARCDYQTYKLEIRGNKCYLMLRNFGEIEVKGFNKKWIDKFKDWKRGDLILKLGKGAIKLLVTFRITSRKLRKNTTNSGDTLKELETLYRGGGRKLATLLTIS